MKESETPLGKAFVKASDALEKRYVTYQYPRGIHTVNFIGDKVRGKVKIEVRNTNSNKLIRTFDNNFSVNDMSDKEIPSEWKSLIDARVPKDYDTPLGKGKPKNLAPGPFYKEEPYDLNKKYPPGHKPTGETQVQEAIKAGGPVYDTPTGRIKKSQAKPFRKRKEKIEGNI